MTESHFGECPVCVIGNIGGERPSLAFEIVVQRLDDVGFDSPQFAPTHALDFLCDIVPVHVGIVDVLAGGDAAQQRGLALGPFPNVGVV